MQQSHTVLQAANVLTRGRKLSAHLGVGFGACRDPLELPRDLT
jgi:hypothetical protein